ncbi:hypothetical protein PIB30_100324 [Stylosanthes scabra]|uniref:Uncharacterized protein n=1 Tax=Stylosanthes scabra TaxID=79078 RepID=A0ABU6QXC5_9FABA|nr:hypothetical protein [Stylosanthes scabra]
MSFSGTLRRCRCSTWSGEYQGGLSSFVLFSRQSHLTHNHCVPKACYATRYLIEGLLQKDRYPVFWELLDKQHLREFLFIRESCCPHLIVAAVTTLKIQDSLDRYGHGNFWLAFTLAGVKYTLGLEASIWGYRTKGYCLKEGVTLVKT